MAFDPQRHFPGAGPARWIGGIFGFIFAGIGVTVLIFLWSAPFGDFGSPPLFFRIFGSFIALGFVAFGTVTAITAIRAMFPTVPLQNFPTQPTSAQTTPPAAATPGRYSCPHCGGALGDKADVSPSGDAKCEFCGRWFNIHRAA